MNKTKHIAYFDLLNIAACLAVVWLHCNGIVHTMSGDVTWKFSLIIECIAYWAVPVFFMLSGATLLSYRERYTTKEFLKKRLYRIVIPFLIWSVLLYLFLVISSNKPCSVKEFLISFVNCDIGVYWFFIPLISIYLTIPVLSLIVSRIDRKYLWYMVAAEFILESFIPCLCKLFHLPWFEFLNFPIATGYLIFVLLGYLLATQELKSRVRYIAYALAISALAFRYFYTCFSADKLLFNYLFFPSVLLAVGVFIFFRHISQSKMNKINHHLNLSKLASYSFGIYLVHIPVLRITFHHLNVKNDNPVWLVCGFILIYLLSLLTVWIIKKIPLLKYIVP